MKWSPKEDVSRLAFTHLLLAEQTLIKPEMPQTTKDCIRSEARRTLQQAIQEGKQGKALRFGGAPSSLTMEWPARLRDSSRKYYPVRGIWDFGCYMGDDG